MIRKAIRFNLDDLWVILGVVGGSFVLLQLVEGIVLLAAPLNTVPTLSRVLLPLVAGFLSLVICGIHSNVTFEFMLRYSVTHRKALAGTLGCMAFETVAAFALAGVLMVLEQPIVRLWLRILPEIRPGRGSYDAMRIVPMHIMLPIMAAAAVGVILVGLIAGAALHRFGRKAFWVLWAICVGSGALSSAIPWERIFNGTFFGGGAIVVGVVLLLAGTVLSIRHLLHASVRA